MTSFAGYSGPSDEVHEGCSLGSDLQVNYSLQSNVELLPEVRVLPRTLEQMPLYSSRFSLANTHEWIVSAACAVARPVSEKVQLGLHRSVSLATAKL